MSVDFDKVANLSRCVDVLIACGNEELDDEKVKEYLNKAIDVLGMKCSVEEIEAALRSITTKYQIRCKPGQSVLADYEQEDWYTDVKLEIEPFFWTRYKNYLIDKKGFSPNVVSTLGEDTLDRQLMNCILNPNKKYSGPVLRRGLAIGDVQSGKTSTYIGFICKAADAGYKVFILLTGTIEALRKQTQERIEEGFVGIDMSDANGKRVGVGEDNKPIKAFSVTSRANDFVGNANKIAITLNDMNAVVFVVKKQKNVLTSLRDWLISLNADPSNKKIDLPMILIDDEADNASINTSKSKEDPTIINSLIRDLANIFTVSNYVGFTATPFANVFIDPETTESMTTQDLFPENFIVTLPIPSDYIGPQSIFASDGKYHNQIEYINDAGQEEEDGYSFYFKHKKEWDGELPESLTDAVYTFYLANAIRDLNGDYNAHRSMLINISRFINVQKVIKAKVETIHGDAYRSIKFNLSRDYDKSMRDPILARIYNNWKKQYSSAGFSWDEIVNVLFNAIEKIQIKVVNSSGKNNRLEYPRNNSLRIIAIGGLALSRGLTLEGLLVSYFYRNTCTYDVLMQMGRWFGYRRGYDNLFRIWTHYSSAEWYAEIANATEQLKRDMDRMHSLHMIPKDFGIRVKNDADDLNVTAYNKMRNSKDEIEEADYFGSIIETPYLHYEPSIHKHNFTKVKEFIKQLNDVGFRFASHHNNWNIIQNVPKARIIDFINKIRISDFSSRFDTKQISNFLNVCTDYSVRSFDIAFIAGGISSDPDMRVDVLDRKIYKVVRHSCVVSRKDDRLSIGRRGKLGGTSDGLIGIVDVDDMTAEEIIESAKRQYREEYKKAKGKDFTSDKTYPSETWFKFINRRRPILLIYFLDVGYKAEEQNQKKQIDEFKKALNGIPAVGFALGFPRNESAVSGVKTTRYKVNKVYNWFEQDAILAEGDEE